MLYSRGEYEQIGSDLIQNMEGGATVVLMMLLAVHLQ